MRLSSTLALAPSTTDEMERTRPGRSVPTAVRTRWLCVFVMLGEEPERASDPLDPNDSPPWPGISRRPERPSSRQLTPLAAQRVRLISPRRAARNCHGARV